MSMSFAKRFGLAALGVLAITTAIAATAAATAASIYFLGPLGAKLVIPPVVLASVALAVVGAELMKKSQFTFGFKAKADSRPSPSQGRYSY
jgi:hypothetical protein